MAKLTFPILEFFQYAHLPAPLQEVSKPFGELAAKIAASPFGHTTGQLNYDCWLQETNAALRKLLEAKDCAVRAHLIATRKG